MKDLVSIVMPVYNGELFLRVSVESVIAQTYKNWELIVVDDCSNDNSSEIIRTFMENDSRIRYYRNKKNQGVSYSRNVGLENAVGRYVIFLDSDDHFEPNYIVKLLTAQNESGAALVICGFENHDEAHSGQVITYRPVSDTIAICSKYNECETLYNKYVFQQLWNKLFIREIIEKAHLKFDMSISMGEDFRFVLAYVNAMPEESIALIPDALYYYNRDCSDNSLMSKYGEENIEEPLKNMRELFVLAGYSGVVLSQKIEEEKEKIFMQYAYHIMRKPSMRLREKYRWMANAIGNSCHKYFIKSLLLVFKEEAYAIINKKINVKVER